MLQPSYGHLDNLIPDLSTVRYVTVDIHFVVYISGGVLLVIDPLRIFW